MFHCQIIDRCIIERSLIGQNASSPFSGKPRQIVQRRGIVRLIIDNKDLERTIGRFLKNTINTTFEQLKAVACGYY